MYFAQGHHLAHLGVPLFDEAIVAWDHGPVVAEVWRSEKHEDPPEFLSELDNGQLNTIGYVASRYGNNTGRDLETLTHNEGPWRDAYRRKLGGRDRHNITNEALRTFFVQIIAAEAAENEIQIAPEVIAAFLAGAREREQLPSSPDTRESLLARLRD